MGRKSAVMMAIICSVLLVSCGTESDDNSNGDGSGPTMKGDRILGMAITEAESTDYDIAVDIARGAGIEMIPLSVQWDMIETAPEVYDPLLLTVANMYYPARDLKVALSINPLDSNNKRIPADLTGLPFNDSLVIARYCAMLDYAFSQIPDVELVSLAIGNEVDIYLGLEPSRWAEYEEFFIATKAHAESLRENLDIGVKATFYGLTDYSRSNLENLNAAADVVLVTYYPLNGDFTVKDPDVVHDDFEEIVAIYPAKPIFFLEAGYPTSDSCNSSEAKQAEFVREVFDAWDTFYDEVEVVSFSGLTDISQVQVDEFALYFGITDERFKEFLRTLGLRTYEGAGTDKQGFTAFVEEAEARGW